MLEDNSQALIKHIQASAIFSEKVNAANLLRNSNKLKQYRDYKKPYIKQGIEAGNNWNNLINMSLY